MSRANANCELLTIDRKRQAWWEKLDKFEMVVWSPKKTQEARHRTPGRSSFPTLTRRGTPLPYDHAIFLFVNGRGRASFDLLNYGPIDRLNSID
ncbi:uncharacterized protein VTP21DRAFT_2411 [Calcarisporiella thermophila]|uniref:uncharacterized protein n=1 Tax=Calcarisporiella thermophila TaxID=911321 RepID=UPI00374402FF